MQYNLSPPASRRSLARRRITFHISRVLLSLAFFATAPLASADWQVVRQNDEPSPAAGLIHRQIELADSETGDQATVDLAIFSPKNCAVRVIDNPEGRSSLADAMRRTDSLAGVNGGYFTPEFAPLGLRIVNGETTSRLVRGRLMTGVLVSGTGFCQLLRVGEFSARSVKRNTASPARTAALECGPFLVDLGKPVRGLEATRSDRRTFVAAAPNDRVALGYCSDATLAGLGKILSSLAQPDFKVQRALNFDGGSSSAFWFKRANGSVHSIGELKYVRDFIALQAK